MRNSSLYWHDYETWGADPTIDRPAQFAGIRTNEDLEPIAEPDMWYCKPTPDVLPHPMAIKVTGITPQVAEQHGLPEPDFMAKVYERFAQPGTCGVGYNSLRFDDEVTRFSLYRNFFDPYAREWQNGNSRWDIIDMVRTCYALRPEGVEWPLINGVPSFRLENLTKANGLAHGNAHDALSDVEATIGLARLVKNKQPQLYSHLFDLRVKSAVAMTIDVHRRKPFLHVSSKFSAERGCAALMAPLAFHPKNKNAVICYDLSIPPDNLIKLSAEEIADRVFTAADDLPEGEQRIPLKAVHLNKCPVVLTPKLLSDNNAQRLGVDKALAEQHWHQLLTVDVAEKVSKAFELTEFAARNAEQALYQGFLPNADKHLLEKVRSATPAELAAGRFNFQDRRYAQLLLAYKARHYPAILTPEEAAEWREVCRGRWFGDDHGFLSVEAFTREVERLAAECADTSLIDKLEQAKSWVFEAVGVVK